MISVNGTPINITIFPDKTSQVWKNKNLFKDYCVNHIEWRYEHEGEIFHLLQLSYAMHKFLYRANIALHITYLPYGRQDKSVSDSNTFALEPFADILNMCKFGSVTILDPHSEKALLLIQNSKPVFPTLQVGKALKVTESQLIVYPDAGAVYKYTRAYDFKNVWYICGEKTRDPATGVITDYKLSGSCEGENVLIVDDICDGGATFIILAKELLNKGAEEVNLFVSHGLFSKGIKVLHEAGIKRIFTKDGEVSENNQ